MTRRSVLNCLTPLPAAVALAGCGRSTARVLRPIYTFGSPGEHDGRFNMPREIGFSPDGATVYVLDRSHRVQCFDRAGRFLRGWQTPPGVKGNPRGMDVDAEGNLYVADTHNSQILVYSSEGRLLRRWGRAGKRLGEFISVTDVALDQRGNVWTCEYGAYNDRLQKFDPNGRHLMGTGRFGSAPGEFSRPQSVICGSDGRMYVADAVNHRVQVLSAEGSVVNHWGKVGTRPGQLKYPYGLAQDHLGRLYVAEFENCRVSLFTTEGRFLTAFGRPGRDPGEFMNPWGVGVATNGEVFVADTMNYRVQVFEPLRA